MYESIHQLVPDDNSKDLDESFLSDISDESIYEEGEFDSQ